MSAWSTLAAAGFAAIAALIAWRVHRNDTNQRHRQEVREATASLIKAMHVLASQSKDPDRDNASDRNAMYQVSVMFELVAGDKQNRQRFNAAMNWIFIAAKIRHNEYTRGGKTYPARLAFVRSLVDEATESLRKFDSDKGKCDLSRDLAERFEKVFYDKRYDTMSIARAALTRGENQYKRLVSANLPDFGSK